MSQAAPGGPSSPWRFVGVGVELIAPLLIGVCLGWWLDGRLGSEPWLLVAGSVLGFVAGFLAFFRSVLPRRGGGGPGPAP
jgi:F0F1-type ATP synthase assembly protein I